MYFFVRIHGRVKLNVSQRSVQIDKPLQVQFNNEFHDACDLYSQSIWYPCL